MLMLVALQSQLHKSVITTGSVVTFLVQRVPVHSISRHEPHALWGRACMQPAEQQHKGDAETMLVGTVACRNMPYGPCKSIQIKQDMCCVHDSSLQEHVLLETPWWSLTHSKRVLAGTAASDTWVQDHADQRSLQDSMTAPADDKAARLVCRLMLLLSARFISGVGMILCTGVCLPINIHLDQLVVRVESHNCTTNSENTEQQTSVRIGQPSVARVAAAAQLAAGLQEH
jgi:hypothetical protein